MSDDLIFEEPPPILRGAGNAGKSPLGLWLAALRQHPGQWARWPEPVWPTTSTDIRKGRSRAVEAGEFETRTVVIASGEKRVTLYVRYVGTPELRAVETA